MGNTVTLRAETSVPGSDCPVQELSECPSSAGATPSQGGDIDPLNMMPPPNQRPAPTRHSKCFSTLCSGKAGSLAQRTSEQRTWSILSRYIMLIMSQLGKRFCNGRLCMLKSV